MDAEPLPTEKFVWSDADYEAMSWHDVVIHAIATRPENYELLLDIDYIVRWVWPTPPDLELAFWVTPATLVFDSVSETEIEFSFGPFVLRFVLRSIDRSDPQLTPNGKSTSWLWVLQGFQGSIRFRATGYKQYLRKRPYLTTDQAFSYEERGGVSFSTETPDLSHDSDVEEFTPHHLSDAIAGDFAALAMLARKPHRSIQQASTLLPELTVAASTVRRVLLALLHKQIQPEQAKWWVYFVSHGRMTDWSNMPRVRAGALVPRLNIKYEVGCEDAITNAFTWINKIGDGVDGEASDGEIAELIQALTGCGEVDSQS